MYEENRARQYTIAAGKRKQWECVILYLVCTFKFTEIDPADDFFPSTIKIEVHPPNPKVFGIAIVAFEVGSWLLPSWISLLPTSTLIRDISIPKILNRTLKNS